MELDPLLVPLRTADVEGQGLSRRARDGLTATGTWAHPRKQLWLPAPPTDRRALHAAALAAAVEALSGRAHGSHETAAFLHGIVDDPPQEVHVTRATGSARRYRELQVHRARLPCGDVVGALTTPARTVVDLARGRAPGSALAGADRALLLGLTSPAGLADVLAGLGRSPGVVRAREVVALADGLSESVLESRSRWLMHRHAVPAPRLQVSLRDELGFVGRVDFLWDAAQVVGEADGLAKYVDPAVLRAEKERQERIELLGFRVLRWGWRDVTDPTASERLVRRWQQVLAR